MSSKETKQFTMFDQNVPDFDLFNSIDEELIDIAAPPLKIYNFNIIASLQDRVSNIDELYPEIDVIDEDRLKELYNEGFNGVYDASIIREGEIFDPFITLHGYYIEPTWTNELSRLGVENIEEELSITFNYQNMISRYGKEIKIGDVIVTFRGKTMRVDEAYIADEVPGWKYIHYRVICRRPRDLDRLHLPN